jgi:hypothetical protein
MGTDYSGSVAGLTASRNRGGAYLRNRAVPVQPNSARQQVVKAAFGSLVQYWTSTLTPEEREAWRVYGASTPYTDSIGDTITRTGQSAFIRTNLIRVQLGLAIEPAAPTIMNTGEPPATLELSTFATDVLTLSGAMAATPSDTGTMAIFVGNPQNQSRNFYKGPYQLAATTDILTSTTTYTATPDTSDPAEWFADLIPAVGMFLPIRLAVLYTDGRYSQDFKLITEITAPA